MAEKYTYQQHERVAKREQTGPPTVKAAIADAVQPNGVGRFNSWLGLAITKSVGTMWAAYAFAALSLVSLPAALATGDAIIIIAWIAQTFLQLVLLPIIIVGQNIQAAASDNRALATYQDAGAILEESKQIQLHLAAQDAAIQGILEKMLQLETVIQKSAK